MADGSVDSKQRVALYNQKNAARSESHGASSIPDHKFGASISSRFWSVAKSLREIATPAAVSEQATLWV